MTRRGQCRCGAVLDFTETALGFKTRCPKCNAVVRLRQEQSSADSAPRSRPKSARMPGGPLPDLSVLPGDVETTDFKGLFERESPGPRALPEMEAFDPPPTPGFQAGVWFWLACLAVVVLVAAGSAWMFWE